MNSKQTNQTNDFFGSHSDLHSSHLGSLNLQQPRGRYTVCTTVTFQTTTVVTSLRPRDPTESFETLFVLRCDKTYFSQLQA